MATDLILSFRDRRPLGTSSEIEAMLRGIFPEMVVGWRESGLEKLRLASTIFEVIPVAGKPPSRGNRHAFFAGRSS